MTVEQVLNSITIHDGVVTSKSTGLKYNVDEFIDRIVLKLKFNKSERRQLEEVLLSRLKKRSEKSDYIEKLIDKYKIEYASGVYIIDGTIMSLDDMYKYFWNKEKMLPTELISVIEDVEKISVEVDIQKRIYENIRSYYNESNFKPSEYLKSLDIIYPKNNFRKVLYNILVPDTKPLFHIFYDDGVGGTGKSTLLEVLTNIVGANFVSNVLLDQFGNRFIFANMLGKYLNIGDDNGKNDELQNVGTLKSIITGNRVTIDRKNISPIEVRIFAKQLFATNILPYIDFTDGGIMRRLNIVKMNKVIPSDMKMPVIDDQEEANIIREVLDAGDLETNENELAITSSPLYRFYKTSKHTDYTDYKNFCSDYGFRCMNVINFEVKSKFIKNFMEKNLNKLDLLKCKLLKTDKVTVDLEELPY